MSTFYGSFDEQENLKVLNRALELGCNFWDTSDVYGPETNEILLSKVLKDRSNEVFICTKFGIIRGSNFNFSVCGTCENSLKRLGIDYIDLYYQFRMDPNTPIEDTVGALAELVKERKIKHIGLSECSANTLRRAHKVHPIAAVQGKYKSIDDFEPNDVRRTHPRFQGENFAKNLELVNKFSEYANKKGVTSSQLCLAWVLAQGDNIITIPGTKKIKYLEENLEAAKVQLSSNELSEIRQILNSIEIISDRYSANGMKTVGI
ncbi:oxidoreductase [Glomus cerebriforme]|uniref:Oxidoreductase n=1 Tax=Glomus cerebriforme TaxID=658196 RepID=A0A397SZX2_9GLOM|nr:oxidoreductase [Glomus cerebriforme]